MSVVLAVHHMNHRSAGDHLFHGNTSLRYPKRNFHKCLWHLYSQSIYAWVKCFSLWMDGWINKQHYSIWDEHSLFSKRKNPHTNNILLQSKKTAKPANLKIYLSKKCLCENTFSRKTHLWVAEQLFLKCSSDYMNLCLEVLLWFRTSENEVASTVGKRNFLRGSFSKLM